MNDELEQALAWLDDIEDAAFGFIGGAPDDVEKLAVESAARLRKYLTTMQALQHAGQGEAVAYLVEFENGEQELHFEPQSVGETCTPLYTTPQPAVTDWPIRGVRVEGDKVIISVKGGNDAARWLCGELLSEAKGEK